MKLQQQPSLLEVCVDWMGVEAGEQKDLAAHLNELDKSKTYVVYDWSAGTMLGKAALLILLSNDLKAYELSCALDGWKNMSLPVEPIA